MYKGKSIGKIKTIIFCFNPKLVRKRAICTEYCCSIALKKGGLRNEEDYFYYESQFEIGVIKYNNKPRESSALVKKGKVKGKAYLTRLELKFQLYYKANLNKPTQIQAIPRVINST